MTEKYQLGQYNTTRKDYILKGFSKYISGKRWIDPFAGNGDLVDWATQHGALSVTAYDIKHRPNCFQQDTLRNPPNYKGHWVITNPPFLARNKAKDKSLFDDHGFNDLYKIALETICNNGVEGGIIILPVNFLSAQRAQDIRNFFFPHFRILRCRIFEETVFDDTSYPICAIYFKRRAKTVEFDRIKVQFAPSGETTLFDVSQAYDWMLGQEFHKWLLDITTDGVGRWTVENLQADSGSRDENGISINDWGEQTGYQIYNADADKNIILIEAIDTGSKGGRLGLRDIREATPPGHKPVLAGLPTSRHKAHVRFDDPPSTENQVKIIKYVNKRLNRLRDQWHSVFLTAFRNSTAAYSRKRVGFDTMYRMINKARRELAC